STLGFSVRVALAATPGAAWAVAHYGNTCTIIKKGELSSALAPLPIAALRISPETSAKLRRVGITHIKDLTALPRQALVRRFGIQIAERLDQALGAVAEPISPEKLKPSLSVNLNFAEPISERAALETALNRLLDKLIFRLTNGDLGATLLDLSIKRVDGGHQALSVGIAFPSREKTRLTRLFQEKLGTIDPGFGIETIALATGLVSTPFNVSSQWKAGAQDMTFKPSQ
ncbi:MAG: DNA polymerase Y family protein, partial [Rhodospirillales bacterium]